MLRLTPPSFDIKLARVAVLMGGFSMERDISIMSGTGVLNALLSQGVDAFAFDPGERALSQLVDEGVTHAFIALHGRFGEDGALQGALELMGIPYTGSGVMASSLAMDKAMTKRVWQSLGLQTPKYHVLTGSFASEADRDAKLKAVADDLGYPLIVKPPHEGSSIGVSRVRDFDELVHAYDIAHALDPDVLCETFVSGLELTCPVLGDALNAQALPVVRIQAPQSGYDYANKYFTDAVQYHCPSGLSAEVESQVQDLSVKAFKALGCSGWGRADLIWCEKTKLPYLLEMNTSPGMTSHSLVPMSAKAAGLSYEALCAHILGQAKTHIQRAQKSQNTPVRLEARE
jgi:D-alanine-D-alanine ligase